MYKNLQYNGKMGDYENGLLLVFTALYISKGFKITLSFCPPPSSCQAPLQGPECCYQPT